MGATTQTGLPPCFAIAKNSNRTLKMLRTRVISSLVAIPIVFVAVFVGGIWFALGAMAFGLIAGWEFTQMMKTGGYHPAPLVTLVLVVLLVIDSYYTSVRLTALVISVAVLGSLVWQLFQHSSRPTADWALAIAGGFYIGWGMAHLVALRELADGLYWIGLALLCTWAADSFAYFTGRAIGKNKLWPRHSPKKTWEGLFGGIAGSIVVAILLALISPLNLLTAIIVGAVIPVAGLFGDLSISLMKRDVGVKDSSNLFPGHGGFLDRVDSLLFVSVVVYYFAVWIG